MAKIARRECRDKGSSVYNFHRRPMNRYIKMIRRTREMFFWHLFTGGRGSEPVRLRGPKTSQKVSVIYGATSGGPNPKLMMTLKKLASSPLNSAFIDEN